jgi:NAD dependent epimerase/dehydratase family
MPVSRNSPTTSRPRGRLSSTVCSGCSRTRRAITPHRGRRSRKLTTTRRRSCRAAARVARRPVAVRSSRRPRRAPCERRTRGPMRQRRYPCKMTYDVLEAAVADGVPRVVAASSASVYGLAEEFPTTEQQHPYANDTLYGGAKVFNEGLVRSFHAMYGLDYVALRYFNVYGHSRSLHRGAHPLDGAHRGRAGSADLRGRVSDDGFRTCARRSQGQHTRRHCRRNRSGLQRCWWRGNQLARSTAGA